MNTRLAIRTDADFLRRAHDPDMHIIIELHLPKDQARQGVITKYIKASAYASKLFPSEHYAYPKHGHRATNKTCSMGNRRWCLASPTLNAMPKTNSDRGKNAVHLATIPGS